MYKPEERKFVLCAMYKLIMERSWDCTMEVMAKELGILGVYQMMGYSTVELAPRVFRELFSGGRVSFVFRGGRSFALCDTGMVVFSSRIGRAQWEEGL